MHSLDNGGGFFVVSCARGILFPIVVVMVVQIFGNQAGYCVFVVKFYGKNWVGAVEFLLLQRMTLKK